MDGKQRHRPAPASYRDIRRQATELTQNNMAEGMKLTDFLTLPCICLLLSKRVEEAYGLNFDTNDQRGRCEALKAIFKSANIGCERCR